MSAAALLAEAEAAGFAVRLDGGKMKVSPPSPPSLLVRLRAAKSELHTIFTGRFCRHCNRIVDYQSAPAVLFADGTGSHLACYEAAETARILAAARRAVESEDALADPGEVGLHGGELP